MAALYLVKRRRVGEGGGGGRWYWFWAAFRPEPLAVNTPPAQRKVLERGSVFGACAIRADEVR